MVLSLCLTAQETEVCCAELKLHEQRCQAADGGSQAAGGAGVDQETASATDRSGWLLQKSVSHQGHRTQPSVRGEVNQPAPSFTVT